MENGWPTKRYEPPETLTIANLRYFASKLWTCTESEFRLHQMKLCSCCNRYTTSLLLSKSALLLSTIVSVCSRLSCCVLFWGRVENFFYQNYLDNLKVLIKSVIFVRFFELTSIMWLWKFSLLFIIIPSIISFLLSNIKSYMIVRKPPSIWIIISSQDIMCRRHLISPQT